MAETGANTAATTTTTDTGSATTAAAYKPPPKMMLSYPPSIGTASGQALQQQLHSVQFTIIAREFSREGAAALAANPNAVHTSGDRITIESDAIDRVVDTTLTVAGGVTAAAKPLATAGAVAAGWAAALFAGTSLSEVAGGIGEFISSIVKVNRRVKTSNVIKLHIPQSPQEQYSAGWSDVEFGLAGAYMSSPGSSLISDIGSAASETGPARDRVVRQLASMSNIASAAGFDFKLQDALELQTGKVPNPYKEQLFKSMDFRSFAFQFKFAPKNNTELQAAFDIINIFRKNMHPERSNDKFFIMYPSEFAIEYQYKNEVNKWLTKIADCALVDMKVDFGAGGAFTSIQSTAGAPTEITMTLQFKELELLTAQHFDDNGFAGLSGDTPAPAGGAVDAPDAAVGDADKSDGDAIKEGD